MAGTVGIALVSVCVLLRVTSEWIYVTESQVTRRRYGQEPRSNILHLQNKASNKKIDLDFERCVIIVANSSLVNVNAGVSQSKQRH